MNALKQQITWYAKQYESIQGGYTIEQWAAMATVDLALKHEFDPMETFDKVYAAIKSENESILEQILAEFE